MKKELRLKFENQDITVTAERIGDMITIEREGRRYTVELLPDPNAALRPARPRAGASGAAGGASQGGGAAAAGGSAPGGGTATTGSAASSASAAATGGGTAVSAPMTGTIKQVMVNPGDQVAEGDHVMMMEAMKMDMEISAPQAGTVGQILCQVGDSVKERQPLLTIE